MPERDEAWLQQLLDDCWDKYFSDVPQNNIVRIEFGKRAKRQLGCIRRDRKHPDITVITMNGLFRHSEVPEHVARATLVHELIHYAHGFNSPLEQLHKHPHAGGVVRREFAERGLEQLYLDQQKWLKANWPAFLRKHFGTDLPKRRRRRSTAPKIIIRKPFWL